MLFFLLAVGALGAELTRVDEPVPGEYIVEFKNDLSEGLMSSHMTEVAELGEVLFEYKNLGEWRAYSVRMDADSLAKVLSSPVVRRVEQNGVMRASQDCMAQQGATWGLVRSAERSLQISGEYKYQVGIGAGVDTYVIDTGIYLAHQDFGGRAIWGTNTADNSNSDGNGHGTHVASTMVGTTYGLCKGCTAYAVKVLNNQGSGTTAGVIAGVDWVTGQQTAKNNNAKNGTKAQLSVGNMSLGGGFSSALNSAVSRCIASGVVMAVAAGNDGRSACNYSPASTPEAITVMASDNTDRRASWSNNGNCCDLFAPGASITAAWINSPTSTNTISGTSMASPHVAGIAAKLIWQQSELTTPAQVWSRMDSLTTSGLISNPGTGSPNKLSYHGCPIA
jgi:subtilisin family serine protease